jgi:cell division protein FtsL
MLIQGPEALLCELHKKFHSAKTTKQIMTRYSILTLTLLLISALCVVTVRHENRRAFISLQELENQRSQMQFEYGRLILEKATWTMENNIADDAGSRLKMLPPPAENIVTIQLLASNSSRTASKLQSSF